MLINIMALHNGYNVTKCSKVIRAKNIELLTIMDSCRTCMARNNNMCAIFDTNSEKIAENILFCTGVALTQEDGLPTNICMECLKDLSVAHKFKNSCLLADKTFRKLIIKTERFENSDVEFKATECCEEFDNEKVKDEPKLTPVSLQNVETKNSQPIKKRKKHIGRTKKSNKPPYMRKYKFRQLYCETCDLKFDSKQQSTEHNKEMHNDNWICEICGKVFIHRASHYSHIKSHLPPTYECNQCDYKTWHKHDLVKHVRIHTGIKTYHCEYCTSSYRTSSNLTGHIRRNHMKEKSFQCELCQMSFYDRTKLNRHIDSHNDVKRFECEVCHSSFTRRCYWKKHLLRQHDIVIPPQRPGRQKTNLVIGETRRDQLFHYNCFQNKLGCGDTGLYTD